MQNLISTDAMESKNKKYILAVFVLALIIGGGFLARQSAKTKKTNNQTIMNEIVRSYSINNAPVSEKDFFELKEELIIDAAPYASENYEIAKGVYGGSLATYRALHKKTQEKYEYLVSSGEKFENFNIVKISP